MDNWDDARFVLALARTGSIRGAARSLAVNHATVSRRIATLESRLSARLFEQTPSGYVLTASGKIVTAAAESVEDLLKGSERRIEGSDVELSGEVHLHIPDFFDDWVCEKLAGFSQQHPKLNIHLTSVVTLADIAHREADIALRITQSPPENMVGRKVWQLQTAIYASIDTVIDPTKDLALYPWVRWSPLFKHSPVELAADTICGNSNASMRVTTYKSLSSLIRHGAGIGFLSPWFADKDPQLKRISPIIDAASMDIWLLIHPDLRGVRRINAITDLLKDLLQTKVNKVL
jgi:DNA-binding transcriptional LysR family regulator